jgi:hypothetical protein
MSHGLESGAMARSMSIDQRRTRMIGALTPACFAFSNVGGVFDCLACGAKGELHLTIYSDNPKPGYLFNLTCFCGCDPQKVADEMMRRAQTRRSRARSTRKTA